MDSRDSYSSSMNDSGDIEVSITLSDRLKAFKTSGFDPDAFVTSKCQHMNEKEIRHLFSYLVELKKASAEEMRRSVYANYPAFIRTSKEISNLEGQLLTLRNQLSSQAALVHGLADGVHISSLCAKDTDETDEDIFNTTNNTELTKIENWLGEFVDNIEVLLVEKRVKEVMAALEEGQRVERDANARKSLSQSVLATLHDTILEKRQNLADQLAETISQRSTRGVELRSAVSALKKLGDGPRAHTLLLNSHQQKLHFNMQSLHSSHGIAFTAALSQLMFATIAQAAKDSLAVFGEEAAYSSELVTWAVKQVNAFGMLVKRHTLASSAAAGGLRVATECIQICMGHCSLLEACGLALSPVLLRLFRPHVEQALTSSLRRIEQSSAALAAADDWSLVYPPTGTRAPSIAILSQPKLSASAHRFNSLVQEFFEDVGPLDDTLQLESVALEGVLQVFNSYVSMLVTALPGSVETEENLEGGGPKIVKMAETEAQQIALLANALLLADELLPRSASKLLAPNQSSQSGTPRKPDRQGRPEQREWKRRLQRSVDRLRDSFCRHHALDLIFTDEGDVLLNGQIYIAMDDLSEEPEWFPSPIFQELFAKLTRMAMIASDMFVGRERFATILLMRMTETVILWLSNDQNFWDDIEAGPKALGSFGLQQFYLDMEFVMIFSAQGRYLSRNLNQVIKQIIARAIEAVSATGVDPYSTLPEDDWFAEVAQIAIKMMTGKANFDNDERDVNSPTNGGAMSARSVSSTKSYGSG